jgi:hypothetical protein
MEIQPFLLSVAYKLRSRYDPNWVPSWWEPTNNGKHEGEWWEDAYEMLFVSLSLAVGGLAS